MSDYCGKHNAFYEALDVMRMEKDIDDILDLVDNLESLTANAETRQAEDKEDRECWKDVADLVDAALPTTVARLHRHALEAPCETTRKIVVTAIIAVEKRISEAAEGWRAAARVGAEMEWRGVHQWMDSGKKNRSSGCGWRRQLGCDRSCGKHGGRGHPVSQGSPYSSTRWPPRCPSRTSGKNYKPSRQKLRFSMKSPPRPSRTNLKMHWPFATR
ncbi:unnamed protein product, partial [Mesorhabditis spiculigera]